MFTFLNIFVKICKIFLKNILYIYKGNNKGEVEMSFDVNVLSSKPIIKAAASMQNDGGGGNLGYMSQGRKKEEEQKKYLNSNIFMTQPQSDVFGFGKEPEMPVEESLIEKIVAFVKGLFK